MDITYEESVNWLQGPVNRWVSGVLGALIRRSFNSRLAVAPMSLLLGLSLMSPAFVKTLLQFIQTVCEECVEEVS